MKSSIGEICDDCIQKAIEVGEHHAMNAPALSRYNRLVNEHARRFRILEEVLLQCMQCPQPGSCVMTEGSIRF
jgi:hypothetical protein